MRFLAGVGKCWRKVEGFRAMSDGVFEGCVDEVKGCSFLARFFQIFLSFFNKPSSPLNNSLIFPPNQLLPPPTPYLTLTITTTNPFTQQLYQQPSLHSSNNPTHHHHYSSSTTTPPPYPPPLTTTPPSTPPQQCSKPQHGIACGTRPQHSPLALGCWIIPIVH